MAYHPINNVTHMPDCVDDGHHGSDSNVVLQVYRVLVPCIFIAIIIVGSIGNALVIYVIMSQAKLRTVTNLLLLNLALSDLAFLLICGTFSVVHYVLTDWPLGVQACQVTQYLLYVTCYVTVYTLVAVSIVRYLTVVRGWQRGPGEGRRKGIIIGVIVLLWCVFLLAKIPILLVHGITYNNATERLECIISGKVHGQYLFGAFFVFAYALPLVLIASLSVLIVRHVRRSQSSLIVNSRNTTTTLINASTGASSTVLTSTATTPTSQNNHHQEQHSAPHDQDRHHHVTRVLSIVVVTFAVCWLPLHVHLLAAYYASIPDSLAYKLALIVWHSLIYVNSMLNPIIYNYFSSDFRAGFRRAILCGKPRDPDEYELC